MLSRIKLMLSIVDNEKDDLLQLLIQQSIEEAKNYTHNDNICELEGCISNMVVYNFNRLGTEGLNSEGYSGVSYGYSLDYPESILRQLNAHRKLRLY